MCQVNLAHLVETLVMNRIPGTRNRGHRELWIVGLLVLPLIVLGFVLAAMGVLVDPPPDPTPTPTIESGSPVSSPDVPAATPGPDATPATGIDRTTVYRPDQPSDFLIAFVA